MLPFLNRLFGKKQPGLYPECLWTVELDQDGITVRDDRGGVSRAPLESLWAVVIETNDSGPWGADFWWILDSREGMLAAFPQGATGEKDATSMLQDLPGFDWDTLGEAVRSTRNASFVVWKKNSV